MTGDELEKMLGRLNVGEYPPPALTSAFAIELIERVLLLETLVDELNDRTEETA